MNLLIRLLFKVYFGIYIVPYYIHPSSSRSTPFSTSQPYRLYSDNLLSLDLDLVGALDLDRDRRLAPDPAE